MSMSARSTWVRIKMGGLHEGDRIPQARCTCTRQLKLVDHKLAKESAARDGDHLLCAEAAVGRVRHPPNDSAKFRFTRPVRKLSPAHSTTWAQTEVRSRATAASLGLGRILVKVHHILLMTLAADTGDQATSRATKGANLEQQLRNEKVIGSVDRTWQPCIAVSIACAICTKRPKPVMVRDPPKLSA